MNTKNKIDEKNVFDIKILINNVELSDYKTGKIIVSIPYLSDKMKSEFLTVYRIEPDGNLTEMTDVQYKDNKITFATNHLSLYAIGIKSATAKFLDVKTDAWYSEAIYALHTQGIVNGREKDKFHPNANITRAEFVSILSNLSHTQKANSSGKSPFSDVESQSWYHDSVLWAQQNNIISGYGEKFKPNKNITREEMASILQRYSAFNKDIQLVPQNQIQFIDESEISSWARTSVQAMANNGIIGGRENGKFVPKANATRAEAVQMIFRMILTK